MAIKTVLSNLLKRYALLSVDMVLADAVADDSKGDSVEEEPIPVDPATGEVKEAQ
jgi:recombinational DNA repair protein RecT